MSEAFAHMGSISAVLGGFAFTFLAVLLTRGEETRVTSITAGIVITSAAAFVLCALGWTGSAVWVTQMVAAGRFDSLSPAAARIGAMHSPLSLLFILGTFLFLASLGMAGWLHSRRLGLFSATIAVGAVVLTVLLFRPLVSIG